MKKLNIILLALFLLFLILFLFSCISFEKKANDFIKKQLYLNTLQTVLDQADALIGKKPYEIVTVHNKKFQLDCIGTVSAIFYSAKFHVK